MTAQHKSAVQKYIAWLICTLLFGVVVCMLQGTEKAMQFFTGYVVELSLSVDNLFVFYLIFDYFQITEKQKSYILTWGIMSALIMRLIFILAGVALITQLHWILYIFGAFLVMKGIAMFKKKENAHNTCENNFLVQLASRYLPVAQGEHDTFFVRSGKKICITRLFLVLLTIETTDLLFAVDSIPAIFGITLDPFIIYTSNAFAICGLRSLYFVIERSMNTFAYLHHGICLVLIFIGSKMLLGAIYTLPISISLFVIAAILTSAILYSRLRKL